MTLADLPHEQTAMGVHVVELATGRAVFEHEADRAMIPASVMKVFAMAAALEGLGPDFTFTTRLAIAPRADGTTFDLGIVGDGDPTLGDPELPQHLLNRPDVLDTWADALLRTGVSTIPGDLLVDGSVFEDEWIHPTWERRDIGKWYAAPAGALNYHANWVKITAVPGNQAGEPVTLSAWPPSNIIRLDNRCRTGKGQAIVHNVPGTFEYRVSGRCSKRWEFPAVSVADPIAFSADVLRSGLALRGITIEGDTRRADLRGTSGVLKSGAEALSAIHTPLPVVLARAGKDSQNLYADCLFKRLGYAWSTQRGQGEQAGSWSTGAAAVEAFLGASGISTGDFVMHDGSGLSRDNRCSASQLTAVLTHMAGSPYAAVFRDSLSVNGVDGSLADRLPEYPGRVHAKTGTMRSVRTLAGYVTADSGRHFVFAVLFNGYTGSSRPYRAIQDEVCRVLMAQ